MRFAIEIELNLVTLFAHQWRIEHDLYPNNSLIIPYGGIVFGLDYPHALVRLATGAVAVCW
jgi:hypothetical protein